MTIAAIGELKVENEGKIFVVVKKKQKRVLSNNAENYSIVSFFDKWNDSIRQPFARM